MPVSNFRSQPPLQPPGAGGSLGGDSAAHRPPTKDIDLKSFVNALNKDRHGHEATRFLEEKRSELGVGFEGALERLHARKERQRARRQVGRGAARSEQHPLREGGEKGGPALLSVLLPPLQCIPCGLLRLPSCEHTLVLRVSLFHSRPS